MDTIQLTGRFKIDKGTTLKDPLITILGASYNYENMTVVLNVKYENNQYSHVRELEPASVASTNGLSKEEVLAILDQNMIQKKQ